MRQGAGITQRREVLMTEQVYSASAVGNSNKDIQNSKLSIFSIFGAIISLNLILWAGYWAYNIISRDINGIPIVAAQPGPLRVAPDTPGGIEAENIELAVTKIASQELPPNPQAVELAPSTEKLTPDDITIFQAVGQKKIIDRQAALKNQIQVGVIEPNLSKEISFEPVNTVTNTANYSITENQSELVAAALALALKPSADNLIGNAVAQKNKFKQIKPRPRPGSLLDVSMSTTETVIRPALASVETGLAVVQFGTFATETVAFEEWDRLSKNLSVILDGRPKYVERIKRNGNEIYRLRLGGFINIDDASRFCSAVISQENCVPVIAN
jgi:hypothetical protein